MHAYASNHFLKQNHCIVDFGPGTRQNRFRNSLNTIITYTLFWTKTDILLSGLPTKYQFCRTSPHKVNKKQTDIPTQQNYLQVVRTHAKFSHTPSIHKIQLKEKNEEKPRAKTISPDPAPICLNFISYSAIKRFFFFFYRHRMKF